MFRPKILRAAAENGFESKITKNLKQKRKADGDECVKNVKAARIEAVDDEDDYVNEVGNKENYDFSRVDT